MLLTQCCDHPYLVDPTLRNSSKEDVSIDSLDVDINVSGKLQLLDKFLSVIKQCGFRVVVLFQVTNLLKFYSNCQGPLCHFFYLTLGVFFLTLQPVDNSEKICIGDILDDLVDRRFGQDSYIRV